MANKTRRCGRCGKRLRNLNSSKADGWGVVIRECIVNEFVCPDCSTTAERAEWEMAAATTDLALFSDGRYMKRTRFGSPA